MARTARKFRRSARVDISARRRIAIHRRSFTRHVQLDGPARLETASRRRRNRRLSRSNKRTASETAWSQCRVFSWTLAAASATRAGGVDALDKMARKLELPTRPRSAAEYIVPIVFFGLAIFTAVSLYRRGSSGWAWLMWGGVFVAIWFILRNMAQNSGGGGGGFSGGSFGGGSSGGGGASGSW